MFEILSTYRLCRKKYAGELLASGLANRWNREGQKIIYCASSRSLASLELLVHRSRIIPEIHILGQGIAHDLMKPVIAQVL